MSDLGNAGDLCDVAFKNHGVCFQKKNGEYARMVGEIFLA